MGDPEGWSVANQGPMSQAIFTLGREGKRVLERASAEPVALERRPPAQLEHLGGVNDIRIAAELYFILMTKVEYVIAVSPDMDTVKKCYCIRNQKIF